MEYLQNMDNATVLSSLQGRFGAAVKTLGMPYTLLTVEVDSDQIIDVLRFAKEDEALQLSYLTDITAVHYPLQPGREFCVVYHVYNMYANYRLRLKAFLPATDLHIDSATALWNGANWMERETFDFYGIIFDGHPDLRRILNMDDLDVFPMRKEYPLEDPNRIDKKDFYFGR